MEEHVPVTVFGWIAFNLAVVVLLLVDLFIFHRSPHKISPKEAIITSLGWVSLALIFNIWIYFTYGKEPGLAFLTGFLLEKGLSVDNLFIFILIFSRFKVPEQMKFAILFYGILGAIIMRAILILGGIFLVQSFSWIFYIFGLFLIYNGYKFVFEEKTTIEYQNSKAVRFITKFIPFTFDYDERSFFVQKNNQWFATPLFLVLILVEMTDFIFALDSVPAILGITTDPFIVYTSNIFAILGLRALYFALEDLMDSFYLLHYALAFILILIGFKMLLMNFIHIPIHYTLFLLIFSITFAVAASLLFPKEQKK